MGTFELFTSLTYHKIRLSYFFSNQLAEAVYEYGKGNYKDALELLGPDFDAADYKVMKCSCIVKIYVKSKLIEENTANATVSLLVTK